MMAFIDVSGDAYGKAGASPWIALNVIGIRKRSIYDITAAFYKLKKEILQNEYIEIKSTDLINKSTLAHPELNKAQFLDRLIYECMDHCDCLHASIAFKNTGENQKSDENHLPKHYVDALWRIEAMARHWYADDAVVVIDNNARHTDRKLAFAFNNYLYKTRSGSSLMHILPVPIFADSETTAGIQLADIAAGIVRQYHHKDIAHINFDERDLFFSQLQKYYDVLKKRSIGKTIDKYFVSGFFEQEKEYLL